MKRIRKAFLRAKYHTLQAAPKLKSSKVLVGVLAVALVAASGAAAYSYSLYQQTQQKVKSLQGSAQPSQANVDKLLSLVSQHMELPQDETPTIATVTDTNKLKSQAFFSKAKNGDKVLIYPKAKKAILFNPTENKIIEVAPVNIGANKEEAVAGASTSEPTVKPTITVRPTRVPPVQVEPTTASEEAPADQ